MEATASPSAVLEVGGNLLVSETKGRMGGGGDGDGPTPLELFQVTVYRLALILTALAWYGVFTLDFFMTSGIDLIDGSMQVSLEQLGDICAGVAALFVPTGSLVAAGALIRLCGLAAIGSNAISYLGFVKLAALAGPACLILIFAREIFWYGLTARGGSVVYVLVFFACALLRYSALESGVVGGDIATDVVTSGSFTSDAMPVFVEKLPVGPPIQLSFVASTGLFITAVSKLFDPIGEDLDEEGDKWFKRSSRNLNESGFPSFKPDLSEWLPPVERAEKDETGKDDVRRVESMNSSSGRKDDDEA